MRSVGRAIGLDVHRDFCEVAIVESGALHSAGRIATTPEQLELFAQSLAPTDRVALEVTGSAWEIARILEPHVARVVVVSPADTGIRQARAKTDRLDARTLARLLAGGELDAVWSPDEWTRILRRRSARREQLVRARSRSKNEIHAVLVRRLVGRPPVSDLFGVKGREWLAGLELPVEEAETLESAMRHVEFLDAEIAAVERQIARQALDSPEVRRLMTVPGVNVICAATFLAAVGDIRRFPTSRKLVGYLGLDPRVYQSGSAPARGGRISKQGSPSARWALVEAAWSVVQQPGPPHAFYERIRARRGNKIAVVACARKLAVLFWCLLSRGEDFAHQQPSLTAKKLRLLEIRAGAPTLKGKRTGTWATRQRMRQAERELAQQAEASYKRMVSDWQAARPEKATPAGPAEVGASVTPGRASNRPSKGKAARQTTSP
ncbi:MAG: IS110 family transposase [Actinomycetota bacterium]|nr:IS110 family transposase [Actinomycetota bacterium]